jgi:tetratricopeptide (TPR) repeat protein
MAVRRLVDGTLALVAALPLLAGGCTTAAGNGFTRETAPRAEAMSLLGQPLFAPAIPAEARARMEQDLVEARARYERDPSDADATIWLGRRLAYLGYYRDAIEVFGEGIRKHPDDARMYRHRGHRFITTRQIARAVADLETAAQLMRDRSDEVEPDGQPNRYNIPTSTLKSNIWYHLALAHYLRHDFESAVRVWRRAVDAADNDDMLVAGTDWLYMTLRRLGQEAEAEAVLERITPDMRILENDAYHRRLLMYKGLIPPDSVMPADTQDPVQLATYGYGIANWHLYNDDRYAAEVLLRRILEGPNWAAFGYIAAEAEVAGGAR